MRISDWSSDVCSSDLLRDMAQSGAARHLRRAVIGLEQPRDDAHQRRFSRTVAPDQPDAAPRRQRRGRAVEDDAPAPPDGDAVYGLGRATRRETDGQSVVISEVDVIFKKNKKQNTIHPTN